MKMSLLIVVSLVLLLVTVELLDQRRIETADLPPISPLPDSADSAEVATWMPMQTIYR